MTSNADLERRLRELHDEYLRQHFDAPDLADLLFAAAAIGAEIEREGLHQRLLEWRDVEDPCPVCSGSGVKTYGSTATWMGGIGGQMVTSGVCDSCWGSGDAHRKWTDLRALRARRAKP